MTTDSFPIRLDTASGEIKFVETDSDDMIVLADLVGQWLVENFDSTSRGRWELKSGTGDAGYVGTITDYYWPTSQTTQNFTSPVTLSSATRHFGLIDTANVTQKTTLSGNALEFPMRFDRTLDGLQEMGDSGGSDEAYTRVQDTLISLIFAHDLPGVYRMADRGVFDNTGTGVDSIGGFVEFSADSLPSVYLDSDNWEEIFQLDQIWTGDNETAGDLGEKISIFQKKSLVEGSATHNLVTGKIPTGGLRLLRKRTIANNFLGLGVMSGFSSGTTKPELQEYFGGGLLNRLYLNQGTGRPGDMVVTTSATPPAGYRNIGGGMDLRNAVTSNGSVVTGGSGGGSIGGSFARQRQVRGQTRRRTYQRNDVISFPNPNRQNQILSQNRGRFNTNYSGNYAVSLNTSFQVQEEQYYLHVKI